MKKFLAQSLSVVGYYLAAVGGLFSIFLFIRVHLASWQRPEPQILLLLDGGGDRIPLAIKAIEQYPDLPILISGYCASRSEVKSAFARAGISNRLSYDLQATDTVTHFTTLVDAFRHQNIDHVYVMTSDFHMARAITISTIIFGSHGIAITPLRVTSNESESSVKILRDGGRSVLWLVTRRSGSWLNGRQRENCPD